MQIEQAVHDELLATSAVTTLVGTNIHYLRAPQDTKGRSFPYIVILKVSAPRTYSFDGLESVLPTRMQLSAFATTYKSAKDITIQIHAALGDFTATMGGGGGVAVAGTFIENETDIFEPETELYHVATDLLIWHTE